MSTVRPAWFHGELDFSPHDRSVGLAGLVVTKVADTTTTFLGLQFVPSVVESNVYLRALIASVGLIPGLLLGTLVVLGLVVGVTESARLACLRLDCEERSAQRTVQFVGYVPLSIVFCAVSLHNLVVILSGLGMIG